MLLDENCNMLFASSIVCLNLLFFPSPRFHHVAILICDILYDTRSVRFCECHFLSFKITRQRARDMVAKILSVIQAVIES